jgi:signal transduction histidine kinase
MTSLKWLFPILLVAGITAASRVNAAGPDSAGRSGSPAQALAMLERAVAAVRADKSKALEMFNNGTNGFRDRDLQPFCFERVSGKVVATLQPAILGVDARSLVDQSGKRFGAELIAAAAVGQRATVTYLFARPGEKKPALKTSYVTAVLDLGCGVGFYP